MKGKLVVVSGFPEPHPNRLTIYVEGNPDLLFYGPQSVGLPSVWSNLSEMDKSRFVKTIGEIEIPESIFEKIEQFSSLQESLKDMEGNYRKFWKTEVEPLQTTDMMEGFIR